MRNPFINVHHISTQFIGNYLYLKVEAGVDEYTALRETIHSFCHKLIPTCIANNVFEFIDGSAVYMNDDGSFFYYCFNPKPHCVLCDTQTEKLFDEQENVCLACSLKLSNN